MELTATCGVWQFNVRDATENTKAKRMLPGGACASQLFALLSTSRRTYCGGRLFAGWAPEEALGARGNNPLDYRRRAQGETGAFTTGDAPRTRSLRVAETPSAPTRRHCQGTARPLCSPITTSKTLTLLHVALLPSSQHLARKLLLLPFLCYNVAIGYPVPDASPPFGLTLPTEGKTASTAPGKAIGT